MNRILKFRAKRSDNKGWVYIEGVGHSVWQNENGNYYGEIKQETISEYTGLKDKNNVEIFEGDFVKYDNTVYSCIWNKHRAEFAWYVGTSYIYPIGDMRKELEIIGNIYENENLLKQV